MIRNAASSTLALLVRIDIVPFVGMFGRPHGGAPTDRSGGTLAAAIEMFVKLARHWWSDTFVRVVGRPHGGDPTDWSGCRGRHPLQNL